MAKATKDQKDERLRCPRCNSTQVYLRRKDRLIICRACPYPEESR
jgi:ribosomal protein L37AE/L43A